jgi:hypothetical protein
LVSEELLDGSAKSRLNAFNKLFLFSKNNSIILGNAKIDPIEMTENGYVNLIMMFGLPAAILLISTQIGVVLSRLKKMNIYVKIIIFIGFFVVGFTNNAFASTGPFLMYCIWQSAFIPKIENAKKNNFQYNKFK